MRSLSQQDIHSFLEMFCKCVALESARSVSHRSAARMRGSYGSVLLPLPLPLNVSMPYISQAVLAENHYFFVPHWIDCAGLDRRPSLFIPDLHRYIWVGRASLFTQTGGGNPQVSVERSCATQEFYNLHEVRLMFRQLIEFISWISSRARIHVCSRVC